jgi:hypothetical protein
MTPPVPGVAEARPLVITGMHRSGTSLVASLFAGAGVHVGTRLIGASRGNDRGHWEDLDFYELHARILEANGVGNEGFSCAADLIVPPPLRDQAVAVIAAKAAATPWGWKDPRTTLFLDFWRSLLPEAVFVFVFRSPWEVADSLFRRGDELFGRHPAFAVRVWHHYNRRILDFCAAHSSRCLVKEVTQIVADPAAVFAEVRERLGVPVGEPPQRFEEPLLRRDHGRQRRAIVAAFQPAAVEVYADLRRLAGVQDTSPEELSASDAAMMAELAIVEWSRAAAVAHQANAAAEQANAAADARIAAEVAARIADLERAKRAAEGRTRELQGRIDELALQVQRLALGGKATDGRHAA